MGSPGRRHPRPELARRVHQTVEFQGWLRGLDADRQSRVRGAIKQIAIEGPTLGRPHVDVIHGSRVHKLKEARVDHGMRVLFAFDSNRNPVMLVGGDKAGKWNRWYPPMIRLAERLYLNHERNIGREGRCLIQRAAGRTGSQMSR